MIPIIQLVFRNIKIIIMTFIKTTIISQTLSIISDKFAVTVLAVFSMVPLDNSLYQWQREGE